MLENYQSSREEIMVRDESAITVKWSKTQRLNRYSDSDLVCLGCGTKIPYTGWLKQQKYIL